MKIYNTKNQLPEPEKHVLAFQSINNNKIFPVVAKYVPKFHQLVDDNDELDGDYNEDTDEYYWEEGWYESCLHWDDYRYWKINDPVVAWQHITIPPIDVVSSV